MASIHIRKSQEKARSLGAWAGLGSAAPLWELSKRELVEIAIRFGALCSDNGGDDAEAGIAQAKEEYSILKENGLF